MDLKPAGVQEPAVPAERPLRVHLQGRGGQTLGRPSQSGSAGHVAEDLLGVGDGQGHAVACEQRPHAPQVAEQRGAAVDIVEKGEGSATRGRGRLSRRAGGLLDRLLYEVRPIAGGRFGAMLAAGAASLPAGGAAPTLGDGGASGDGGACCSGCSIGVSWNSGPGGGVALAGQTGCNNARTLPNAAIGMEAARASPVVREVSS